MPDAYERIPVRGVTLNRRTFAMLELAEEQIGRKLTVLQGSFSTSVADSELTHAGGGVLDIDARRPGHPDRLMDDATDVLRELRKIGFAAWLRRPEQDPNPPLWPFHIHAVAIGDKTMHAQAKAQVDAYLANPPVEFTVFPQTLPEDDVLNAEDKAFLRELVHGLDKTVKVVDRDRHGAQVETR
ncbi:MAG: hypothetical protein L0Y54_10340 [Sporichthyaceae bacterium]|nr:hypothetical protein [Sporichthyaceae bacterium]